MFIATIDGNAVWASSARRTDAHTCPGCGSEVKLKAQNSVFMQAHFAHVANSSCGGLGVESDEHFALKYWYIAQLESMGASDISYEKRVYINEAKWRQPDIAFTWKGRRYAIEVQRSKISDEKILERTNDLMMAGIDRAFWVIHDKWVDAVASKTHLHIGGAFSIDRKSITAPLPSDMIAMPSPCFWSPCFWSSLESLSPSKGFQKCRAPDPDFSRVRTEKILKLQLETRVSNNGNMVCHATVTTPSVRFTSYLTYEYNGVAIDRLKRIVKFEQTIELGREVPGRPVTPFGIRTVTFAQKGDWWRIYDIDKQLPPEPPTTTSTVCASGTKRGALGEVCVDSCTWKFNASTWQMFIVGAER